MCIVYLKTNIIGKTFKNTEEYRKYVREHSTNNDILLQFLNISGQLLKRISLPLEVHCRAVKAEKGVEVASSIREDIQLRNMPQQGFVLFYGDDEKNILSVYKSDGTRSWHNVIKENALGYVILPSGQDVYMLMRKTGSMIQGDYEMARYGIKDSITYPKYKVWGRNGNSLRAVTLNNDPVTGKPFLSGYIIKIRSHYQTFTYTGLFTLNFNGGTDADPDGVYSYWKDSVPSTLPEECEQAYSPVTFSFKDFAGNAYFAGISFTDGIRKGKRQNSILIKQDAKGVLSVGASIPSSKKVSEETSRYRSYSAVYNKQTKSCYFIVSDLKTNSIYDISKNKIARAIPRKDDDSQINIFPAKEGHVMVSEYNKKEKYTRISIEAL